MCVVQFDDDVMFIIDCLKNEFKIDISDRDRERQVIWLIWNQRENLNKCWTKCEAVLSTFTTSRDSRFVQPDQRHEELVLNKIKVCFFVFEYPFLYHQRPLF